MKRDNIDIWLGVSLKQLYRNGKIKWPIGLYKYLSKKVNLFNLSFPNDNFLTSEREIIFLIELFIL